MGLRRKQVLLSKDSKAVRIESNLVSGKCSNAS